MDEVFAQNSRFSVRSTFAKQADKLSNSNSISSRLQDKQLQEMSDHGMCLSMHQVKPSM